MPKHTQQTPSAATALASLDAMADAKIAEHSTRFFKTAPGQYGEGDKFLGIRVPQIRKIVSQYKSLPLSEVNVLLYSEYHEARLCALLILVSRFKQKRSNEHQAIFDFYLENLDQVNNWDLVDSSAHPIVGGYLYSKTSSKDRALLYQLADSENLWHRRVAIIATYHFIKRDDFADALALSEILLTDKQDLIHKAVGWMLREIGKKDYDIEYQFLVKYHVRMPRTMLRYAIEKFSPVVRKQFLLGQLST
ncbi:DNA alkylation repair protein [Thalassotalea euphylliae]|uniref:DNA alkylation repair protein n=1 Tax=Thalassotalea euphylliae TaxID=1655234 RepID=A0A3E0UD77_9GAMM|nr:DNA alkylation repair protein [Thalassotalea euphylliae]REL34533.1 DNA alkylation repair protein [Thalassotalea euphylliae]